MLSCGNGTLHKAKLKGAQEHLKSLKFLGKKYNKKVKPFKKFYLSHEI